MIEHQLRPLFGFFEAATIPSGIYASAADFTDGVPAASAQLTHIDRAVGQLSRGLHSLPAATADGRGLAAATAEVIFTAHQKLETAQEFYRDIKARARSPGRNPDHILIMSGVSSFVGRTEAEAREKYDRLTSLIPEEDGIALNTGLTGDTLDLTGVDLDGPLPPRGSDRGDEIPSSIDPPDRR